MKFLKKQILSGVIVLSSLISLQMQAGTSQNMQQWWRSTYFTDYLPLWVQSYIPRARVRQMFYGALRCYVDIRYLGELCTEAKMNKLVKNYNKWMQQYKGIINQGTIFSGVSIKTGNPDSLLGFWKSIFLVCYQIDKENVCILSGIKKIIGTLEDMGAQVNPLEQMAIEEPYDLLAAKF